MENFNYRNVETKMIKGGKTVRKVVIKKGNGYKSITHHKRGKRVTVKKPLDPSDILKIKFGKFIPGLFDECKHCKK